MKKIQVAREVGTSLVATLFKEGCEKLQLKNGDYIEVEYKKDKIIIKKMVR